MKTPRILLACVLLSGMVLLVRSPVLAQEITSGDPENKPATCTNFQHGERPADDAEELPNVIPGYIDPPNPDGATKVDIGLFIEQITEIDEVNDTFQIEGILTLIWCDNRLSFGDESSQTPHTYVEEVARNVIDTIWWPNMEFANKIGPRINENAHLQIFPDGTVQYQEDFQATISNNYDLHDFPFDRQRLIIEVSSFSWNEQFLEFNEVSQLGGVGKNSSLAQWEILSENIGEFSRQEYRSETPFSVFQLQLELQRVPGFYLWKVMTPLFLLVLISWAVFWIERKSMDVRIGASLTAVLTIVAYQFTFADTLPRISYFTYMDIFFNFSFVLVLLTIVELMVSYHLHKIGQEARADRLDDISKWAFPLIYVVGLLAFWFLW